MKTDITALLVSHAGLGLNRWLYVQSELSVFILLFNGRVLRWDFSSVLSEEQTARRLFTAAQYRQS